MLAVFGILSANRVSPESGGFTYSGTSSLPVLTACLAVFSLSLTDPCCALQNTAMQWQPR